MKRSLLRPEVHPQLHPQQGHPPCPDQTWIAAGTKASPIPSKSACPATLATAGTSQIRAC